MKKNIYVLDTSVLVDDPFAFKQYINSEIIIPIISFEELDKVKKNANGSGKNARVCIKAIDEISELGDISTGILLSNENILLKVDTAIYPESPNFGDPTYGDTHILRCAYHVKEKNPNQEVILVSNDINLRLKARAWSIMAESYHFRSSAVEELYSGIKVIVDPDAGYNLKEEGFINPQEYGFNLNPHECILFEDDLGNGIAIGRKTDPKKISLLKKNNIWKIFPKNKEQAFAVDLIMDPNVDLVTLTGKAGCGKTLITLASALELVLERQQYNKLVIYRPIQAVGNDIGFLPGPQPLDAKILTPNGWTTMGELKVGDLVIGRDGKSTTVSGVYPKGIKSVYKITTSDGLSTEACEDHLWSTSNQKERKKKISSIKTTKQIQKSLNEKHFIPRNEAVEFNKKNLPLDPYLLGVYLGDGNSSDNHFTIYSSDQEIIEKLSPEIYKHDCHIKNQKANKLSFRIYPNKQIGKAGARNVKTINVLTNEVKTFNSIGDAANYFKISPSAISSRCNSINTFDNIKYEYTRNTMKSSHPIISKLMDLELYGKKAWDKFIPKEYLYSSIEDRVALLQGLMDTDGSIKKNGECSFTTTSETLANNISELVRSLGGRANPKIRNRLGKRNKVNEVDIIARRVSYEFTISLPGNINPFSLNRKSKFYNSNKNPAKIRITSIDYVGEKEVQCIKVESPEHLYVTDNFIITHNTMEEKLGPWFQAVMDSFEVLFSSKEKNNNEWKKDLEMFQRKGKIEMEAITYIRGRSIPNAIILVDEAQNLCKEDMKTILTRAGQGTKIILTGDIEQIDNQELDAMNNGLTFVIDKFKESELAGHITFTKGERSRLATKASEIL